MRTYNKLVRDGIPEIIEKDGEKCNIRIVQKEELGGLLEKKLQEEVNEFLEDNNLEELADIMEVVFGLAHNLGYSEESLLRKRDEKRSKRGGFKKGIFLESVIEKSDKENIKNNQPEFINIDETLRLRKFDNKYDFALSWYEDDEILKLVDGENADPYDNNKLTRMYNYLNSKGELYFIEIKKDNEYIPIGDVTFWKEDMPIVIGDKNYRGCGIGYKVISALIKRARFLGYDEIFIDTIFSYNIASQKTFEKAGFKKYKETEKGYSYVLKLK